MRKPFTVYRLQFTVHGTRFTVHRALVSAILLAVATSGCVKRSILIESVPPGAQVWINENPVGKTPVEYEFITHGRYKFRLQKDGFRELTVREMVWAPVYQWIPLDFISEHLLPVHWEDKHLFQYTLSPQPPAEKLQVEKKSDIAQFVRELKSPDPEERRLACVALAIRRDPETAPALEAASFDPVPKVRGEALGAMRAIRGPQAIDRLVDALRHDPEREIQWRAAIELEALGDVRAVPALVEALKDKKAIVRTGAAEALKGIPSPLATQPLIRALRDKDTAVRRAATEGLGKIGDRAAVGPLCKALFFHDVYVRRKAAESLARLKDPSCGLALVRTFTDWDPVVRRISTDALIAFGDERVVPILIRRLRGLKPWTRQHAAQVLGGLKDPRSIEPLKQALRRENDEPAYGAMLQALQAQGVKIEPAWIKVFPKKEPKKPEQKGESKSTQKTY